MSESNSNNNNKDTNSNNKDNNNNKLISGFGNKFDFGKWSVTEEGIVSYSFFAPKGIEEKLRIGDEFIFQLKTAVIHPEKKEIQIAQFNCPFYPDKEEEKLKLQINGQPTGGSSSEQDYHRNSRRFSHLPTDNCAYLNHQWYWNTFIGVGAFVKTGFAECRSWEEYLEKFNYEGRDWFPKSFPDRAALKQIGGVPDKVWFNLYYNTELNLWHINPRVPEEILIRSREICIQRSIEKKELEEAWAAQQKERLAKKSRKY
jgi:hypothetical protein